MANVIDARPTINIDNSDNAGLSQSMLNLVVSEDVSGLYRCEATFGNQGLVDGGIGYPLFDRRTLDFGKTMKVKIDNSVVFDGRIMTLEAVFPYGLAPSLTVLAEDRFQDLRMARRTRVFNDKDDRKIIESIAHDHRLSTQIDITTQTHKVLAQVNQSDLAFLRELGRAIDAEIWVEGSTLHAQSRAKRGSGSAIELRYGEKLEEFIVTADLAHQRTSVTVSGWDTTSKASIKHEATASIIDRELNGDEGGIGILQSKIGARKEMLAHTVPLTSEEAQNEAEAYLRMSARRFVVGRGTVHGESRLRVGKAINLTNLGPLFNGKYTLTEVRHLFGSSGLTSEFTAERPGIGKGR